MKHIVNSSGRLLHAAYSAPGADGKDLGRYIQIDGETPGIPPGSHDIDDLSAKVIEEHPTNQIFFATGMLAIKDGAAPKLEKTLDKGPKIFRVSPGVVQKVEKSKSTR